MTYATSDLEQSLWNSGFNLVCGVDEVGRGCFAGPVVVGAVVFSAKSKIPKGLADSKLLKPSLREELSLIIQDQAEAFSIAEICVEDINIHGIGQATQMGFKKSVLDLKTVPDFILIDAFFIKEMDRKIQQAVKHGDRLCVSIAAASIIAKVYRDTLMKKLHLEYPNYGFDLHKGYGTKMHREAIKKYGLSKLHRTSFKLEKFAS